MESSKEFGVGEECNSSNESGWTEYLCSPKDSNQSDVYDGEIQIDNVYENKTVKNEYKDESDDSMASDASSGPIRLVHSWRGGENVRFSFGNNSQAEEKIGEECFSNKKANYQKQEKEESVFSANEAEVSAKVNGKVKKNSWFGKRK